MCDYLIVIEGDGSTNYSTYCPDLPGVVATGGTIEECRDYADGVRAPQVAR